MKCGKIIVVRSLLIFCLGLTASQLIFATNRPQNPITITTLFVHSWLPELGKPAIASGSVDDSLFAIAGLVLDGDYNSAEKKLNDLEQRFSDNRTKVSVLLWRRQLEQRRYRFLSGGTQIFGAPMIDAINIELIEKDRNQQLQTSIRQLSPDGINDSRVAEQYGLFFWALDNFPAQIRSRRLFAEVKETNADDSALRQQEEIGLKTIEDNGRVAVQLGLIGKTENQLAMYMLMAQVAVARGDSDTASSQLKTGLALASQAGLQKCAAEFMLRLGDLEAIPFGNALTFGYSCLSESQARLMLKGNIMPSVRRVPSATALANAEVWYKQAESTFNDLQQGSSYEVKIRWAHLARMRGDSIAATQLYQEAAELGRRQKAWTAAAVADASAALLLSARTRFFNSLKSLQDRGDRGAMISVAEVAHSWGATNRYLLQNYTQAITTFRMLADVLVDSKLDREAVDILLDLASLQGVAGRSEMAITALQEAVDAQRRYLTAAETKEKQYQAQIGLMQDKVGLAHERNLLGFLLTQLLSELELKVITEGPQNWLPQRIRVREELAALNSVSSYQSISDSRAQEANKIQFEVHKAFQDKKCEDALPVFNDARPRAAKLNQPLLLLFLDAAASKCDPKLIGQLRAEMQALNPVDEIRKAQESAVALTSFKSQLNLQQAVGNFQLLGNLAASVGLYDLLTTWMDQLDEMIRNDSKLQGIKPMSQGFRAVSLLGQNHALEARAILNKLSSDEQLWASFDQDFKLAALSLLVETESVLGNTESALLALERLRSELEEQQELRSGVRPALRMSAEQARLEREISIKGSITPQQSSALRRLRDQSAQLANEPKHSLQPSDLKTALAAIPPNTTVLIYHIGPQGITRWQASADHPLKMVRLPAPLIDTIQHLTKLQNSLAQGYALQDEPRELYQRLFAKTDPIKNGDVIAVVATGILSRLPFEILGPTENDVLMKDHPIVYLDRLCGTAIKNSPLPTDGQGVLVAGLNSNGLTEAQSEAKDVAALLHSDPLLGADVTNEKIMDRLKSARWVHLATHADIDSTNPYASYLVLAGKERIEAWELFRYAPQAELIVLSACKTKAGIQPLVGPVTVSANANSLASFALAGGAKWIIASLWSTDDRASAALMREFYSYLVKEHLDPPHALQKAKQNAASTPGAQPFKYAQFLLSARNISSLN